MLTILIADDDHDFSQVLKMRLQGRYECKVLIVSTVENALELCSRRKFDIVFCDYIFGSRLDGFNFIYTMKKEQNNIKLVLMSGHMKSMDEVMQKGLGITPDAFVTKPLPANAVEQIVEKYYPNVQKIS